MRKLLVALLFVGCAEKEPKPVKENTLVVGDSIINLSYPSQISVKQVKEIKITK